MKALLAFMLALQAALLSTAEEERTSPAETKGGFTIEDLPIGNGEPVVLLRNATEFDLSGVARMPKVAGRQGRKAFFWVFIDGCVVQVSHLPTFNPDGNRNGGRFEMLAWSDGPSYEFVKDSDAERNLLSFLMRSYFTLLKAQEGASATILKMKKYRETTAALSALSKHYSWSRSNTDSTDEAEQGGARQPATHRDSEPAEGENP